MRTWRNGFRWKIIVRLLLARLTLLLGVQGSSKRLEIDLSCITAVASHVELHVGIIEEFLAIRPECVTRPRMDTRTQSRNVPGMRNAGQCIVELNGSIRTHVHLSFAFSVLALPWIVSKTSGKQSAHSLGSPEDEVGDLFCLGWIHVEVFANLFNILDGLLEINMAVVTYHRNDVCSENLCSSKCCRPS